MEVPLSTNSQVGEPPGSACGTDSSRTLRRLPKFPPTPRRSRRLELPRFRGQVVVLVPNSRLFDVHRSYQQRGLPPQAAEALHFYELRKIDRIGSPRSGDHRGTRYSDTPASGPL